VERLTMTIPAAQDVSLGFIPGDHVCAFYSSSQNVLDDIVVDYITKGLQAGNKVFCMVDEPSAVHGRVPPQLVSREGMLHVLTEDQAYMPDGSFSKDVFIANMETMAQEAADEGYGSFRAVGDESFLVRNGVDIREWFAAESELNKIVPDYPHFFFCLYDLDLFDGDTVMYVLRTHPRVYVNGIIIGNPHYQASRLPG
jgi:MEDS: MEthanogen/methylotroph, DcmR Sensory domain